MKELERLKKDQSKQKYTDVNIEQEMFFSVTSDESSETESVTKKDSNLSSPLRSVRTFKTAFVGKKSLNHMEIFEKRM